VARRRRSRSDSSRPLAGGTRSPRADGVGAGFTNPTTGLGSQLDGEIETAFWGGCPLSYEEIGDLILNNALARRMVSREADDSLREGIRVKGEVNGQPIDVRCGGKADEKAEAPDPFAVWCMRWGIFDLVKRGRSQANAHGSAFWVFGVDDGRPSNEPLELGAVRRLDWIKVITGGQSGRVTVSRWGIDRRGPRFEQPTHYWVSFPRSGLQAEFHYTRLHQWIGVDVPEERRVNLADYGGSSMLDLVWTELKGYGVSLQRMLAAIGLLSQGVWTNSNLAHAIDSGNSGKVASQYERMRAGGGLFGDYVLDAGESYGVVGRPIAGLPESIERTRDALVAGSGMGEAVLLGAQPSLSGLNNDADAGIRGWYDEVSSRWEGTYQGPLSMLFAIASRALNGPTGGVPILGLMVQQPSLWSLTPAEAATVRAANATARATDLGVAVISVGEARSDSTLADEYELAPEGVATVAEPEVAPEDLEVADADLMPPGESPIGWKQAAAIIGRKSPGSARNFAAFHNVPIFQPMPGGAYRVFESHLRAAMRESQVV
jgi:hypothetical protein